jgi:hypothetical protein
MATPSSPTKNLGKTLALGIAMGLTGLGILAQEGLAATRPVRPGGSTPPPTVVNPDPPPRPSQMVAGRNAGNMVLSTPISRTSSVPSSGGSPQVKVTSDP